MSSIPTFIAIQNVGPLIAVFEPAVAGSAIEWSMFFEQETEPGTGDWHPMDFNDVDLIAEVRKSIYDTNAIQDGVQVEAATTPGYLNFFIGANITAAAGECELQFGFKVSPGAPTHSKVHVIGTIPVLLAGVR